MASCPYSDQLLVTRKFWSPGANRPSQANILDTGAHFYEVYECADGRWISVAAIEGKFYAELLRRLDLDPATMPPQMDREHWPEAKAKLAALFTRSEEQHV